MRRRSLLAGASAALASPAIAAKVQTLRFVPQAPLTSIDPVSNPSIATRNAGLMVFETLYGRDESMNPRPHMVQGDRVEDTGHRWTLTLREHLLWHDGTPVLARDCVASLRRWMKRDPGGATLETRIDALEAPDDRRIVLRLNKPYPNLRALLARFNTPAVMMPERIALTDPFKPIPEAIGCGPFRWLPDEQVIGSHAAFARFDRYTPRNEPPSFTAGGHVAQLDRVEWRMAPDAGTAAQALIAGKVDWLEVLLPDLISILRRADGVSVGLLDNYGQMCAVRVNHLIAPTNNVGVRRAMLAAVDQRDVITAMLGDQVTWFAPIGFLDTGNRSVDEAGLEAVRNRPGKDEIKAMLDQAGYNNERVVLLHPTDYKMFGLGGTAVCEALRAVGFNLDDQMMDWGSMMRRRTVRDPVDKGGWSLFPTAIPAAEYRDPLLATLIRADGVKGFYGWPSDDQIEALYQAWLATDDPTEQIRIEQDWQQRAFDEVIHIPLGRFVLPSAWRNSVSGQVRGPAVVFWNVSKL